MTLPYPGLDIRLFTLTRQNGWVAVDTLVDEKDDTLVLTTPDMVSPRLLVAGVVPKAGVPAIQALTPAEVFVPWSLIGPYAAFVDHSGHAFALLRPGIGLL
jgi:hypothetical protein